MRFLNSTSISEYAEDFENNVEETVWGGYNLLPDKLL